MITGDVNRQLRLIEGNLNMASLRTLVIAQNLPYPTFNGADLRNWHNNAIARNVLERMMLASVFSVFIISPRRLEVFRQMAA